MIDIDFTFLVQLVNFLVLMFILHAFLFRPVLGILDQREKKVSGLRENAADMDDRSEKMEADFKAKTALARKESMNIIAEMRQEAAAEQEKIVGEAKRIFMKKMDSARSEIKSETEKVSAILKDEASSLARQLASKVLGRGIN